MPKSLPTSFLGCIPASDASPSNLPSCSFTDKTLPKDPVDCMPANDASNPVTKVSNLLGCVMDKASSLNISPMDEHTTQFKSLANPTFMEPECLIEEHPLSKLLRVALLDELVATVNPYVTKEALVLRVLQRLAAAANLSWTHLITDQAARPCILDESVQRVVLDLWNRSCADATADEQQCLERALGRDRVRPADVVKLAQILYKRADKRQVWSLFAVDGFRGGDDPKLYAADAFKHQEGPKADHVAAVRQLYRHLDSPEKVRRILEFAWDDTAQIEDGTEDALVQEYRLAVPQLDVVRDWRRTKEPIASDETFGKKRKTEGAGGRKRKHDSANSSAKAGVKVREPSEDGRSEESNPQ